MSTAKVKQQATHFVSGSTVTCPPPEAEKWNQHPTVTLKLSIDKPKTCPYCSTIFLKTNGQKNE